jgi:hypothetical protein
MGRFSGGGSYGHRVEKFSMDHYRVHWTVDRYYAGHRCRFPRECSRDTDLAGAKRFCRKWGLNPVQHPELWGNARKEDK